MAAGEHNKKYYESSGVPELHGANETLMKAAEAILSSLRAELKDKPILDLGVGAGRTTPYLMAVSRDYIGADYSEKMIEFCRKKFHNVRFYVCDARRMRIFSDEQFAAVFFWGAGIDCVSAAERLLVLEEIRRVLKPDGVFSFSANNLEYEPGPHCYSGFYWPDGALKVVRINLMRIFAFAANQLIRLEGRIRRSGYAVYLGYEAFPGVMLRTLCISSATQLRQLLDAGFHQAAAISLEGRPCDRESQVRDHFLYYVARKA